MSKYTNANRRLRALIRAETGFVVLHETDQSLMTYASTIASKFNLPAIELIRQYRHYCSRLRKALKSHYATGEPVSSVSLKHRVKQDLLQAFKDQPNFKLKKA